MLTTALLILMAVTWFRILNPPVPEAKKNPSEEGREAASSESEITISQYAEHNQSDSPGHRRIARAVPVLCIPTHVTRPSALPC